MFTNLIRSLKFVLFAGIFSYTVFINPSVSYAETGSINRDSGITKEFEDYHFDTEYKYYFSGLENSPIAIIGLMKDHAVDKISWAEVNPNSDKFKHIIELIKRFPETSFRADGANMFNSRKEKIGTYYSGASAGVFVNKDNNNTLVAVYRHGSDK